MREIGDAHGSRSRLSRRCSRTSNGRSRASHRRTANAAARNSARRPAPCRPPLPFARSPSAPHPSAERPARATITIVSAWLHEDAGFGDGQDRRAIEDRRDRSARADRSISRPIASEPNTSRGVKPEVATGRTCASVIRVADDRRAPRRFAREHLQNADIGFDIDDIVDAICLRRSQSTTTTRCPDIAATRAKHIEIVVLPSSGSADVMATTFNREIELGIDDHRAQHAQRFGERRHRPADEIARGMALGRRHLAHHALRDGGDRGDRRVADFGFEYRRRSSPSGRESRTAMPAPMPKHEAKRDGERQRDAQLRRRRRDAARWRRRAGARLKCSADPGRRFPGSAEDSSHKLARLAAASRSSSRMRTLALLLEPSSPVALLSEPRSVL